MKIMKYYNKRKITTLKSLHPHTAYTQTVRNITYNKNNTRRLKNMSKKAYKKISHKLKKNNLF